MGQFRRDRIVVHAAMRADANVEMRHAEGHGEIAVEHLDLGRGFGGAHLPGGTLNDRAEGDVAPMIGEEIAQQLLEARRIGRQREDLDGRAIGFDDPGARCRRASSRPLFAVIWQSEIVGQGVESDIDAAEHADARTQEADRILVLAVGQVVDAREGADAVAEIVGPATLTSV